jgi:hypothetical protein
MFTLVGKSWCCQIHTYTKPMEEEEAFVGACFCGCFPGCFSLVLSLCSWQVKAYLFSI